MSYIKYYVYKEKVSNDGGETWEYTGNETPSGNPIGIYSTLAECDGEVPPGTIYRWVNIDPSIDYYCYDTTKYYKQKRQVSIDGGVTWSDVIPEVYQMGAVAETESDDCGYIPVPPDPTQYLTIIPLENGEIHFPNNSAYYSTDSGSTWISIETSTTIPMTTNVPIWFKATREPAPYGGVGTFSSTAKYKAEGNVMSLLYGDDFIGETDLTDKKWAFNNLFHEDYLLELEYHKLVNAERLVLPATTLDENCYVRMFWGCAALTKPPIVLPATTLPKQAYYYMFNECRSLRKAPQICATTVGYQSCYEMFEDCESLIKAPELPATTLDEECYKEMFVNCKSLKTAPSVLPATSLAKNCYNTMFSGCTSLTTPPELPATTLIESCYMGMFEYCKSLKTAPVLPATTMVGGCYYIMFYGCSSLKSVTCLATVKPASGNPTGEWLRYVPTYGTFTKASGASWDRGDSGIPTRWTVIDAT